MERPLLNDQGVYPSEEVLKGVLGASYPVYKDFVNIVTGPGFELMLEWNYYKDGKSWICKATFRKKTVFWFSVWEGSFKVSFYFTEKTMKGILDLEIDEGIKTDFRQQKPIGKLIPLVMEIVSEQQLKSAFAIVNYKKLLK